MILFSIVGCLISYLNYREDARTGSILEYPENSFRVQILKQMIDRDELMPLIKELEIRHKKAPHSSKKVQDELTRHLDVQI